MDIDELTTLSVAAARVGTLAELFARDAGRSEWLTLDACGIHADFSRQRIDRDLFAALETFAQAVGVAGRFEAMFTGDRINNTENRAVLHVACRADSASSPEAALAAAQRDRAAALAESVRGGRTLSSAGRKFAAVVNIGIGGSDLGPAMATRALRRCVDGPHVRFVSNIDGADLDAALVDLDPATTLFVVSSKTFTTVETMHNAERARRWSRAAGGDWASNFVAVTARPDAASAWGIGDERCLRFFDWVGGRFSLSSVIGFPVMCAIGGDRFVDFLGGMRAMDEHARLTPFASNLPMVHAAVWFANSVLHAHPTVAVVPYSNDLSRLPAYLQQLVMESNGKSVLADGTEAAWGTSPVVWGEPGTNGQHAFFQMIHQGTQVVPVEFIGSVAPFGADAEAHDVLMANMFAQSEALAAGRTSVEVRAAGEPEELVGHKSFPGNRPSSVLMLPELSPGSLGALVAMYEHSTAVQGWLLGINSFDQWGVELGKGMALSVSDQIGGGSAASLTMTHPLVEWYRRLR